MSDSAVADTIAAFARAAADAMALGFDTVELHGAHGYLIDQYFWSGTNLRADAYGGSAIGERTRFAAEIIAAVRVEVGPDFPIILRVSQWKQQDYDARIADSPNMMAQWLEPRGFVVENVLLKSIQLPRDLAQAVEDKLTAEQRQAGVVQGRNTPAELPRIAAVVAGLRGISCVELARATRSNACAALPRLARLLP